MCAGSLDVASDLFLTGNSGRPEKGPGLGHTRSLDPAWRIRRGRRAVHQREMPRGQGHPRRTLYTRPRR
jgi:hypothetical protein